ncbi:MAG TPA: hypothetical protein V6D17_11575 [Candidatus Obscuribacterales bacterium]
MSAQLEYGNANANAMWAIGKGVQQLTNTASESVNSEEFKRLMDFWDERGQEETIAGTLMKATAERFLELAEAVPNFPELWLKRAREFLNTAN